MIAFDESHIFTDAAFRELWFRCIPKPHHRTVGETVGEILRARDKAGAPGTLYRNRRLVNRDRSTFGERPIRPFVGFIHRGWDMGVPGAEHGVEVSV